MKCEHCETRISGKPFDHNGHHLCCECMSELTSWFLDGGMIANPVQFSEIVDPAEFDLIGNHAR